MINEPGQDRVAWRKTSRSGSDENCVEVARTRDTVTIRDSKNPSGPTLAFTPTEWHSFVHGVKTREFPST